MRLSTLEIVLSRADRRAADLIEQAYSMGARFDGWDDLFNEDAWRRALEEWPINPEEFSAHASIPINARLPWDHIEVGPSQSYLRREHRRSLLARSTSPCLRPDDSGELICHGCGADCDLEAEAERRKSNLSSALGLIKSIEDPEDTMEAGPPFRYRLLFAKRRDLIWLGHLDTVRLLIRLFRRASIRLAYSHGFHPKPKLSFAAPLQLGMGGLGEVADFSLIESTEPDELRKALGLRAPAGLEVIGVREVGQHEPAATRQLAGAELLLASPDLPDDLEERSRAILARDTLVVERKRGEIELRSSLLRLDVCQDNDLLTQLGLAPPAIIARVTLGKGGPAIRQEDLLRWFECNGKGRTVIRLGLFTEPLPTPLF